GNVEGAAGDAESTWLPELGCRRVAINVPVAVPSEDRRHFARLRDEPLDLVVVGIGQIDDRRAILDRRRHALNVLEADAVSPSVNVAKVEEPATDEPPYPVSDRIDAANGARLTVGNVEDAVLHRDPLRLRERRLGK